MKAIRYHEYGGPDVLRLDEVEAPKPGPGQVRITVHAAGVNPMDWRLRSGSLRNFVPLNLPAGVGVDAAGVVDALGEGVNGVVIGDKVFGKGANTAAEHAVLAAWAAMPDGLTFEEAAGLSVPFETASRALRELGLKRGETLLLTGAAGGVGTAAMQLAREAGIRVIAAASERKHDYLRTFGGIPVTYGPGLAERVNAVAPNGIDAALDLIGNGTVVDLIAITGKPEMVVTIVDFEAQRHGARTSFGGTPNLPAVLRDVAGRYQAGTFRMPVERSFPLSQTAAAQKLSQEGHVTGRLVLTVDVDGSH